MTETSTLRDLVVERLAELELTQAGLARRAGVNAQFINDLIKGKKDSIRPEFAFQLALALGVAPVQILRLSGLLPEVSLRHLLDPNNSDRLQGVPNAPLNIFKPHGESYAAQPDHLPVIGRPFRMRNATLQAQLTDHMRSLTDPTIGRSDGKQKYWMPSRELENRNFPILAEREFILISADLEVFRGDLFVGYVVGDHDEVSAWAFRYLGRENQMFKLGVTAAATETVRLPVRSLVLAHLVVGTIDRRIIRNE